MKKLVIAEKPSVGREIARTLSLSSRNKGYIEGSDYIVTWALGHLVELAEPSHYSPEYRRWTLSSLPMLPEKLDEVVIEDTKEQFDVISDLLKRSDVSSVVIATDAGREGELVARWILKMADYRGVCERLWISSQTELAIKEGFSSLRPSSDYDTLYKAAECRAMADWYVGMNVTRALTCFYDAKLSAGRVQTPTLSLITKREDERDEFLGSCYYTARGDFSLFSASYYPEENTIRFKSDEVKDAISALSDAKGVIKSLTEEEKRVEIPLCYDLTELQRDANASLGFSAKETLDTLQNLYEVHKVVSYPRTDSRYISKDIVPTLRSRLMAIRDTVFGIQVDEYLSSGFREDNPRFVDDGKVSDHHAIIPTEKKVDVSKFSPEEEKLWRLIAMRFLEVLGNDYRYKTTTAVIDVEGYEFKTRVVTPIERGYRNVSISSGERSTDPDVDSGDASFAILSMKEGDEVVLKSVKVRKHSTEMPERYTEGSLLYAMEHAGRLVEDDELRENLSGGLGTPATRADIIEKLIQNRYVERDGKYLVPTEKGRELVRLSPEILRSPELTGKWEKRLEDIRGGCEDPDTFMKDIKRMASDLVLEVEKSKLKFAPSFKESKKCPYCGSDMMRTKDPDGSIHYICQTLSCQYEEREVKVKISSGTQAQTVSQKMADGKVRIIRRKGDVKIPSVYETKIEVIRESKRKGRSERVERHREEKKNFTSGFGDLSGGTMADFFKKSLEKNNERKERKRK